MKLKIGAKMRSQEVFWFVLHLELGIILKVTLGLINCLSTGAGRYIFRKVISVSRFKIPLLTC